MESEPRAMSMSEDDIQGIPNKWLEVVIHYAMGSRNDTIDFSKPHLRPSVARMYPLFVFLYVVIVIAGTFSNCAMIYSIIRDKLYRDQTYCYLINMALGDIVKCVFVLPISLMVLLVQNWVFGSFLCYFLPMLQDIPIHVSMLTFLMIAYDRHRFLQDPTKPRIPAFVCATGTWLMALCIVLPYPIYTTYLDLGTFNRGQLSGVGICAVNLADDMQEYMRGLFIAMYVLPLAVMAYLYVRMSRELQLQEGPLAVIMYEARSRASTNFRTCRSVSDMSSSDAPDEDIETDVETLNYQQCLATQSISGKRESGHSEPHFRYRSPTANFDLYEAELDLRKEKRAQKYLISMVTMFGICLCPLMVLRLAKLALPETYENSGHFDITFTMFVWIAFLPTCITPLLYASWRMSRSAKERLRGYFRLSNRHLRRSSESPVERRSGQNHETSSQNNVHGGRNSDGGVWLQYCEFKYYYLLTLPAMPLGI